MLVLYLGSEICLLLTSLELLWVYTENLCPGRFFALVSLGPLRREKHIVSYIVLF